MRAVDQRWEQRIELIAVAQLGQAVGTAEVFQAGLLLEQFQLQRQGVAVFAVAAIDHQQQIAEVEAEGGQRPESFAPIQAHGE